MSSVTVIDIVKEFLRSEGFDGLYNPGMCSCALPDIVPCGTVQTWCRPGWVMPCNGVECDNCGYEHVGDPFGTSVARTRTIEEQACMVEQIMAEIMGLA